MFGFVFVKKDHYDHLITECSKMAIANVEMSKDNARQTKIIQVMIGECAVLNARISLLDSINDEICKRNNKKKKRCRRK